MNEHSRSPLLVPLPPSSLRYKKPKVPVVQVTPFLLERENTWCKDKSLPEFYEKPDVVHDTTESFKAPQTFPVYEQNYHELTLPISKAHREYFTPAPPKTSHSLPPRMSTRAQDNSDALSVSSQDGNFRARHRLLVMNSPRNECISPDFPIKAIPKHGYAPTIVDREKKTQVESDVNKPQSLLNREKTQEFISKQQVMRLNGVKMREPFSLNMSGPTEPSEANRRNLEHFYRHLVKSYSRGYGFTGSRNRFMNYPLYVESRSRRTRTDPLLSVNHESVDKRLSSSMDSIDSKSAFRILKTAGKPTSIEQNLARDYQGFVESKKQQGSAAGNGQNFTRYMNARNYNPTQGEIFIRLNREQNRPGQWNTQKKIKLNNIPVENQATESWLLQASAQNGKDVTVTQLGQENTKTAEQIVSKQDLIDCRLLTPKAESDRVSTPERIALTTTLPDLNNNTNASDTEG